MRKLRTYSLDMSECYGAADKEAIIDVIGEWYADEHAGEADPAELRRLGCQAFESLVRHELAPLIEARAALVRPSFIFRQGLTLWLPRMLDWIASPTVSLQHAAQQFTIYLWFALGPPASLPLTCEAALTMLRANKRLYRRIARMLPFAPPVEPAAPRRRSLTSELMVFAMALPLAIELVLKRTTIPLFYELPALILNPRMLGRNRFIPSSAALESLRAKHEDYSAPDDELDPASRALYKQQAVVLLLMLMVVLALLKRM